MADSKSKKQSTPKRKTATKPTPVAKDVQAEKSALKLVTAGRFVRVTPRKIRIVAALLIGKPATEALDALTFINRAGSDPLRKLLGSAIANAGHNHQYQPKDLILESITADDGPTIKRYMPRAHGRSMVIRKRTSHINVRLSVRPGAKAGAQKKEAAMEVEPAKVVAPNEIRKEAPQQYGKGSEESGRTNQGFLKKIFNRKTG